MRPLLVVGFCFKFGLIGRFVQPLFTPHWPAAFLLQTCTYDLVYKMKQFYLACIVMDKESGNSRGFGYVTFAESNDAEAAKNALQAWVSIGSCF
jgi:hypothetical protein